MNETEFRALLDENGILREGALRSPARDAAFTVFSQRPDAVLDMGVLKQQASRFFNAKLGLTVEKKYASYLPETDAARIVLSANEGAGTRLVFGRRADGADLAAAEEAEREMETSGMSLLAQRCPTVWLIPFESADDRVALTIAAIFASVMLGPIVSPSTAEIFGVRTARLKLEGRTSPYR